MRIMQKQMQLPAIKHRLQSYLLLKRQMLTIYMRHLIAHSNPTTSFQSLDMCASIISKLIASNVPNTVVSSTIESLEDFIDDLKCNLKEKVLNIVPQNNPSRESLENVFESFDNPFSALNTDNKLKRYFYRKWGIVQPVEVPLGIRYDTKRNRQTGAYEQLPVNDKFIYIPILKTLEFIFKNSDVCDFMQDCTQSDIFEDFCDGTYFKNHPLFSSHRFALQIQLYYDDFEAANPLGSKKAFINLVVCTSFSVTFHQK